MRARPFDPAHLDVRRFAERAATLEGELPVGQLARLRESTHPECPPTHDERIHWEARGESLTVAGGDKQPWLSLHAEGTVRLTCQRCLQAVEYPLQIDRRYRFVADEATAAAIDVDADEDILVDSRAFDLRVLIEDELLLALPLVPRHEGACPSPLLAPPDPAAAAIELAPRDKPFAALGRLKSRKAEN